MSQKYGIQYPPLPNASTQAFITQNVTSPTGNLTDDFRMALVNILGLADHNDLCLDDLWQQYIVNVVAGSSIEEPGSPASAGRGKGGFVGNNPGHYISRPNLNDPGGSVGFPGGGATFSYEPDNLPDNVTLSNSDATVTNNASTSSCAVDAHASLATQHGSMTTPAKLYWEFYIDSGLATTTTTTVRVGANLQGVAVDDTEADLTLPNTNSALNAVGATSNVGATWGDTYTAGDVIMCAWEPNAGKMWFGLNGTWLISGDPAAGTNPSISSIPTTSLYVPSCSFTGSYQAATVTLRLKEADFTHTPPTGFTGWDDVTPASTDRPVLTPIDYFEGTLSTSIATSFTIPTVSDGDLLCVHWAVDTSFSSRNPRWDGTALATLGGGDASYDDVGNLSHTQCYYHLCDGTESGDTFDLKPGSGTNNYKVHFFTITGISEIQRQSSQTSIRKSATSSSTSIDFQDFPNDGRDKCRQRNSLALLTLNGYEDHSGAALSGMSGYAGTPEAVDWSAIDANAGGNWTAWTLDIEVGEHVDGAITYTTSPSYGEIASWQCFRPATVNY